MQCVDSSRLIWPTGPRPTAAGCPCFQEAPSTRSRTRHRVGPRPAACPASRPPNDRITAWGEAVIRALSGWRGGGVMSEALALEEAVEFAENQEPRCPCVLLLDTSGSMQGAAIDA